jgi:hypothetical protein
MIIYRNEIIAIRPPVRWPRFYLEGGTEVGDNPPLAEIKVSVFSEIVLLRNLLKNRAVAIKECLRDVDALAAHNALG